MHTESLAQSGERVIQAQVIINGRDPISKYSKNLKDFFDTVIVPWLNRYGYKSYGIMKQLRDFVSQDQYFKNDTAFLDEFAQYLKGRSRNVRGGGSVPVLQPFNIGGLSRPAWPQHLREHLQAKAKIQEGGNIRHIVRNNTLKKALELFCQRQGREAMITLAGRLGVNTQNSLAFDACIRALYKMLYLNIDNLWIGDGLVNQMIGFLATPLSEYGQDLARKEIVFNKDGLYRILMDCTRMVRGRREKKMQIINEIGKAILDYAGELKKAYPNDTDFYRQMGIFLDDVGLNLGFDLIDDRSDNTQNRQSRLLNAERLLQQYIITEGQQGDLTAIFAEFLNINKELDSSSDGEEETITGTRMETEEEGIPAAPSEAYKKIEYNTREFELIQQNNCLIRAIAKALNIHVQDYQIINIRTLLNDQGYANVGDMLDVSDDTVRNTILLFLNVDYSNYTFRIFNQAKNQYYTFPLSGGGAKYINLIYTGNHFISYEPPTGRQTV